VQKLRAAFPAGCKAIWERTRKIGRLPGNAEGAVFLSLCGVVVRQVAAWRLRSNDLKELEIVVLRHELAILRRRTAVRR
jgi:hypothetical protein